MTIPATKITDKNRALDMLTNILLIVANITYNNNDLYSFLNIKVFFFNVVNNMPVGENYFLHSKQKIVQKIRFSHFS